MISGELSPWISIGEFDSSRGRFAFIWNPAKRSKKALFDLTFILVREAQLATEEEKPKLQLSIPYLLLAYIVDQRRKSVFSMERQFCLVQRSALFPTPVVVFTSAFHRLTEAGA